MTGFLTKIEDGCFSDSLSITGGYNSTEQELEMNIIVELKISQNVQDALKSLSEILNDLLALDQSFYAELSVLQELQLDGGILVDISIGAAISSSDIDGGNYGDIDLYARMNRLEVTTSLYAEDLSLDLPLSLPGTSDDFTVALNKGSFSVDFFVTLKDSANLTDIFADNEEDSTNLFYNGTLHANFPIQVGTSRTEDLIEVTLQMKDDNLFDAKLPEVDYELDVCPLIGTVKDLVDQLEHEITGAISDPLSGDVAASLDIDLDPILDPLTEYVSSTLSNFTSKLKDDLDSIDCDTNVRFLREANDASFVEMIQNAIDSINDALKDVGISIDGDIKPYFNSAKFAVGIDSTLTVNFKQTVDEVIDQVKTLFDGFMTGDNTDYSKLGFEDTSSGVSLDLNQLKKDTIILAGERLLITLTHVIYSVLTYLLFISFPAITHQERT